MQDTLSIPAGELEQIIAAHDGDVALLWLCLRRDPGATLEDAARLLCRTKAQMDEALEKLQRMGLAEKPPAPVKAQPAQSIKLPPADETPPYTVRDIAARSRSDPRFADLVTEAQRALGHVLNTNDIKILFSLYDYLALPPEVIMMLLNYCVGLYPTGSPPSMRQIEKEGYVWANREILTIEQAEEYIAESAKRREKLNQAAKTLGITDRKLSPSEKEYITSWLEMGFDDELLAIALDRTIIKTGGRKWKYMNSILKSWHEKGLHTPADVRDKDARRPGGKANDNPQDLEKLLKGLDNI